VAGSRIVYLRLARRLVAPNKAEKAVPRLREATLQAEEPANAPYPRAAAKVTRIARLASNARHPTRRPPRLGFANRSSPCKDVVGETRTARPAIFARKPSSAPVAAGATTTAQVGAHLDLDGTAGPYNATSAHAREWAPPANSVLKLTKPSLRSGFRSLTLLR
jgi:hypothetical protein